MCVGSRAAPGDEAPSLGTPPLLWGKNWGGSPVWELPSLCEAGACTDVNGIIRLDY